MAGFMLFDLCSYKVPLGFFYAGYFYCFLLELISPCCRVFLANV